MAALLVLMASLLTVALCGGGGVVLQQIYGVVEVPLEFLPAPVELESEHRIEPIEAPPGPTRPSPRLRPRDAARPRSQPVPSPEAPGPEPTPVDVIDVTESAQQALAAISVSGDGEEVVVSGRGKTWPLPASVPPGTYEVRVRFGEGAAFVATTFLVLDATPRQVTCRASRGICRVVP